MNEPPRTCRVRRTVLFVVARGAKVWWELWPSSVAAGAVVFSRLPPLDEPSSPPRVSPLSGATRLGGSADKWARRVSSPARKCHLPFRSRATRLIN